ncbi:MAG: PAS domain-containing protein [Verrucomicrobia bacterium]|nr:PAS domain-containing protein [Verrucomicrobiota bacterium]
MRKGLNFRQKIILSHILLFFVFALFAFPFIEKTVNRIVFNNLQINTCNLIEVLQKAQNETEMIDKLKKAQSYIFFRVSLFDSQGKLLYDSALGEYGDEFGNYTPMTGPQVRDTIKEKILFYVDKSVIFQARLAYVSIAFDLNVGTYILRTAIPFSQVEEFTEEFKVWFFAFCALALLFFGSITWLIFHRINFPIQQIIKGIKPYQSGQEEVIPRIELAKSIDEEDDFYKLAQTLNSLSDRLRLQIKNITDERNEKEAILESLGEGVIAVDAEMNVRYVNFIGSKMIGMPRRQILGKTFPVTEDKTYAQLLEKCRNMLAACQEKLNILTDSISIGEGKKIYLDLIAAPKAQRNGAILVLQDKSSHYKVLEMGKDFVANASHELRTPITIIKGFAETLQDLPELPRDMVVDITEKIVRNCQRMDTLVKNLLTLADLENLPDSRFQECDLIALTETCRQVVKSVYEDAQITIQKSHESIAVSADPDILELAIINLLDNAAKYSNPPAQITVKLVQEADEACITISDKGIGIPPADLEHIFERFYTVDKARSRRLGGAGLGLSIVRTIIEKHHGTISVSSTVGQGTTFSIHLPIKHKFRLGPMA